MEYLYSVRYLCNAGRFRSVRGFKYAINYMGIRRREIEKSSHGTRSCSATSCNYVYLIAEILSRAAATACIYRRCMFKTAIMRAVHRERYEFLNYERARCAHKRGRDEDEGANELIKSNTRSLHKSQSRLLSAEFRDNLTNGSRPDE